MGPEIIKFPPEPEQENGANNEYNNEDNNEYNNEDNNEENKYNNEDNDEEIINEKYRKYIDKTVMDYLYLDSKDIESSVELKPEDRRLFYILFKEAKFRLYKGIGSGARQAELIMIYWGNKKFYEILSQYDIMKLLKFYDNFLVYFREVSGVDRVPALNLSTVLNNERQKPIYVHTDMKLHGEFRERSELFDINIGDLVMIDIILFFNDFYINTEGEYFGEKIMEFIRIGDRLKETLLSYRNDIAKHLLSMVPNLEKDIRIYKRNVENDDGNPRVLKEKEKILGKILKALGQEQNKQYRNRVENSGVTDMHANSSDASDVR